MIALLLLACGHDYAISLRGAWVGDADYGDGVAWPTRMLGGNWVGPVTPRYEYQGITQIWHGTLEVWAPDGTMTIGTAYNVNICESDEGCIWNGADAAYGDLVMTTDPNGGGVWIIGHIEEDAIVGDMSWPSGAVAYDLTLTHTTHYIEPGTPP